MDNQDQANKASDTIHGGPVQGTAEGREPVPTPKPSQAEGDRETIDQDLQSIDQGGEQQ